MEIFESISNTQQTFQTRWIAG